MSDEFNMEEGLATLSEGLFPQAEEPEAGMDEVTEPDEIPETEEVEETPEADPNLEQVVEEEGAEGKIEEVEPDPTAVAPKTWRKEAAAEWETLSPTVKAEIAKREEDMFKGIEGYKLDANIGQNFKQAVLPHLDYLQRSGVDPYAEVDGLLKYSQIMRTGTTGERMALMGQIAQEYGIDLLDLAASTPPPAYVDPAVKALQDQNKALQDQFNTLQSSRQKEESDRQDNIRKEAQLKITTFAADPAHEHFSLVEKEMAALISYDQTLSLDEAYKMAVRANPLTYAKEQTRQAAESLAVSQAKAEEARKATSVNVKTNARSGRATAPTGSIDDTLAATLAEIRSR